MRELPSQVKETLSVKGRGSAGLRRLSRRGSWVRIPPPAPRNNQTTAIRSLRAFVSPTLAHGDPAKVIRIYFPYPLSVLVRFWACFSDTGSLSAYPGFLDPRGIPE